MCRKVRNFLVIVKFDLFNNEGVVHEKRKIITQMLLRNPSQESDSTPSGTLPPTRAVLVVDDAPMNRRMLCRLLVGHCDYTVEAEDGAIAVQKLRKA